VEQDSRSAVAELTALYLDLIKRCLTDLIYERAGVGLDGTPFAEEIREHGRDWPVRAHTMIGVRRLDNLQASYETVHRDGIPGDLIETGVWRGGATIFMRALLEAYGDRDRTVWVADSFRGLPEPDAEHYPADTGDKHHTVSVLAVPRGEVEQNFAAYGLLDDRVRFVEGWFRETLPAISAERFAIVRLDGDMYESTMQALETLYPRLSLGGFLIVDDYGAVAGCARAVDDYRARHGITDPVEAIDWAGVFWRRR
jgi:O-methyltransferase